jgi:nitrile hydratase subunit beta
MCYASRVPTCAFRDAVDRMAPGHYLSAPYWERVLTGLASIMVEQGLTTAAELAERAGGTFPLSHPRSDAGPALTELLSSMPSEGTPRFRVGDVVTVREWHPKGHTRCPRYAQGKRGVVVRVNAHDHLPDLEVASGEVRLERTYAVRFDARTIWGDPASANEHLHLDLFESYLSEAR